MAVSPTPEQYIHDNATVQLGYGLGKLTWKHLNWTGKFDFHHHVQYSLGIPTLLISLVGMVGNGLVLWLLGFRIQRNPFSVYVLNLAGADALFLCLLFLDVIDGFVQYLGFLEFLVLWYLRDMSYTLGLSLLATISSERCLSVLCPIWYRCHRPKHTSPVVCALLWILVTLLWAIGGVSCLYVGNDDTCNHFYNLGLIWFLLLTWVMCVSSLTLLLRVQCSSRRQQPPRFYLVVLLNVLVFLLCGVPAGIVDFIWFLDRTEIPFSPLDLLTSVNSSANPFIYFFLGRQRHKRRRETLRVILQRALEDKQDLGAEGEEHPPIHHDSEMSS